MITDLHSAQYDRKNIYRCRRCRHAYDWRRSTSKSLKMTYCGALCEVSDLGFTVDELLRLEARQPKASGPAAAAVVSTPEIAAA